MTGSGHIKPGVRRKFNQQTVVAKGPRLRDDVAAGPEALFQRSADHPRRPFGMCPEVFALHSTAKAVQGLPACHEQRGRPVNLTQQCIHLVPYGLFGSGGGGAGWELEGQHAQGNTALQQAVDASRAMPDILSRPMVDELRREPSPKLLHLRHCARVG